MDALVASVYPRFFSPSPRVHLQPLSTSPCLLQPRRERRSSAPSHLKRTPHHRTSPWSSSPPHLSVLIRPPLPDPPPQPLRLDPSAAACLTCVRPQRGPRSCLGPPASSNRARRGVLCPATGSTLEQPDSPSTASPAFVCCVGAAAREPSSISLPCCVGHLRRWCRRSSGGIDASIGS
ncbi:hypothetical protein ACQJBY_039427 [Aegilops geniculata]